MNHEGIAVERERMRTRSTNRLGRVRRAAALACAAAGVAAGALACGEPTAPVSEADLLGTYVLRSVGGQPLPFVLDGPSGSALLSARITLLSDGRYTNIDSAGIVGSANRMVLQGTGTWRLEQRSGGRQFVWTRSNKASNGAPSEIAIERAVRERGRTLESETTDASGRPEKWVYKRER